MTEIDIVKPTEPTFYFFPLNERAQTVIKHGFNLKQLRAFRPITALNIFYGALQEGSSNQHLHDWGLNVSSTLAQIEGLYGVSLPPSHEVTIPTEITVHALKKYHTTQSGKETIDFAQRIARLAQLDHIDSSSLLIGSVFAAQGDFRSLLRRNGLTPRAFVYGRGTATVNTPQG